MRSSVFLGTHCEDLVEIGAKQLRTWRPGVDRLGEGARMWLSVHPDDLRVMSA